MPYFLVAAYRTITYRVEAEDTATAIDAMIDGDAVEVDGVTHRIDATLDDDQAPTPNAAKSGKQGSRRVRTAARS